MTTRIAIASGKGGVGKTLTSISLSNALVKLGHRVLLVDCDLGLSNVDVLLGIKRARTMTEFLEGRCGIRDLIVTYKGGLKVIPSESGIAELVNLSGLRRSIFESSLNELKNDFDFMIFDIGAGINDNVFYFLKLATRRILVTTAEPHALTDCYALFKICVQEYGLSQLDMLVNQVKSEREGSQIYQRFASISEQFLQCKPGYLGCVPHDPQLSLNLIGGRLGDNKSSPAVHGWHGIAHFFVPAGSLNEGIS